MTSSVWAYSPYVTQGKKIVVAMWDKGRDGAPDVCVRTAELKDGRFVGLHPNDIYVTDTRYVTITEENVDPAP